MKIVKIISISFLFIIILGLLVFRFWYPNYYSAAKGIIGSQMQWHGFEDNGTRLINNAIAELQEKNQLSPNLFHSVSVQNTKNGNYDEAIEYLDEAIKLSPEEVDGYYGWLLLHYYRDYKKALTYLIRKNSYTPNMVDYVSDNNIYYAIGLCYKQLNQLDSALIYMNKAIESELQLKEELWMNHRILFHKARIYHLMNQPDSATTYYNKVIHNWKNTPEAYFYKGLLIKDLNQLDSACIYFDQSLELLNQGYKTEDSYVLEFDEIFEEQVRDTIGFYCK